MRCRLEEECSEDAVWDSDVVWVWAGEEGSDVVWGSDAVWVWGAATPIRSAASIPHCRGAGGPTVADTILQWMPAMAGILTTAVPRPTTPGGKGQNGQ